MKILSWNEFYSSSMELGNFKLIMKNKYFIDKIMEKFISFVICKLSYIYIISFCIVHEKVDIILKKMFFSER